MRRYFGLVTVIFALLFLLSALSSCAKKEEVPPTPTGAVIVGKAVLSGEKDFSGITVSVEALGISSTTDASGSFKLSGLTEGVWKVKVEKEGFVAKEVEVTVTGTGTVDIGTIELVRPSKIKGIVTLEGADDHSGITVLLQDTFFKATTAKDGSFEIGGLPEGSYVLVAQKEGWEQKAIDVTVGVGEEVDIGEFMLPKPKVPGLPAGAKLLYFNDFEKLPVGSPPPDWEYLSGGASGPSRRGVVDVDPTNPGNKVFYVARIDDEPIWVTGDPKWKDYVMEWDWYIVHDSYIAMIIRAQDSDNFITVSRRAGGSQVGIWKRTPGTWSSALGIVDFSMPVNTWFRCQFAAKGDTFTFKAKLRDDKTPFDQLPVLITATDATFATGRCGAQGSDYIDNFLVYVPKGW